MKHTQDVPSTKKSTAARSTLEQKERAESSRGAVSEEERQRMIATAAYYRAECRGFAPGLELEDWLSAETEIKEHLCHG